jgi:tetratricopeptide (TPR) repeat protein
MSQLKAFVGHSFTEDDGAVVRAFLKFFDQVKNMNIGFSWEHAEPAEPKELAEKVLRLIEDKNLFIEICTNKEAAIQTEKLRSGTLKKKILKAEAMHFSLKTSDWIIQEIGLAIGRHMDLILLVEKDIRQPGGLQGNIEYIAFERKAPEKSFGKVLEMIQSLLPRAKPISVEEAVIRSLPEEKVETKEQGEEMLQPKADWDRKTYEFALVRMMANDNKEGTQRITNAYLDSEEGKKPENRASWEACQEYLRIVLAKGGQLSKLEEIAKSHSHNSEVRKYVAMGYRQYDDHEKAAQQFEVAAEMAGDVNDKFARYSDSVLSYSRAGRKEKAILIITKIKGIKTLIEDGEARLIKTLRELAEMEDDKDLLFGLTEQLLHLRPDDSESRFTLAYNYSQAGQDDISLFHYLKIPYGERGSGTWNNLGVEFDHFDLSNSSVKAYRKAEELYETLAMSNLSQKLMKAGFLKEAEEICNRALKIENYHKNVSHAISRIKDIPEEEEKKEKEVVDKAKPLSEFYRNYGHALLQEDQGEHTGRWRWPDCELRIMIKGNRFEAEGAYEQQYFGLLREYTLGLTTSSALPKKTQYRIRYEGHVAGRTVKCTMKREKVDEPSTMSSLLGGAKGIDVLMILSESLKEIKVYEKGEGKERKFYVITRIE